jgi:hypothetical protein
MQWRHELGIERYGIHAQRRFGAGSREYEIPVTEVAGGST